MVADVLGSGGRRDGNDNWLRRAPPDEPDELTLDCSGCDGRAFPVPGERSVALPEAGLCLPRAGSDLDWDLLGELRGAGGPARAMLVVPGRFDQQPAGVRVAGLGDVPAVLLDAGGVLAGVRPRSLIR